MVEGWWNEDYFVLFAEDEVQPLTERYSLGSWLPGFTVLGLKGWDSFIVRDQDGVLFVVPTVPAISRYLQPLPAPIARDALRRDSRWEGKIKWWIQPIVFGGDPGDAKNVAWVSLDQHAQLVRWWNEKYRSMVTR